MRRTFAADRRPPARGIAREKTRDPDPTGERPWSARAFEAVGGSGEAFWRAVVGGGLAFWAYKMLADRGDGRSWAEIYWVEPALHFKYPGFGWVTAPPEPYTSLLVVGVLAGGVSLALGLFTRASAALAAACFTWLFLIERTAYQNHYYLLVLVSWAAVCLPLGAAWSLDNLRLSRPARPVPRWAVWLVRFQVGLPYLYGGIAKLHPGWLSGEPMGGMLRAKTWLAPLAPALPGGAWEAWFPALTAAFTFGGLLFDLLVVPGLLWRRTRPLAYAAAVAFHLTNATLFRIGVFPWFMIAATLVFFAPDWPAKLLRLRSPLGGYAPPGPRVRRAILAALAVYAAVQATVPLRHHLYPGNVNWTEAGHPFSWHMMLRGKNSAVRLTAEFADGTALPVDLRGYLTPGQAVKIGRDPDLVRRLAVRVRGDRLAIRSALVAGPDGSPVLRRWAERPGPRGELWGAGEPAPAPDVRSPVAVRALVLTSYNDRRPQLLIDPAVDLSAATMPWWGPPEWILPLVERPRTAAEGPWREDVRLWDRLIETDPDAVRRRAAAGE